MVFTFLYRAGNALVCVSVIHIYHLCKFGLSCGQLYSLWQLICNRVFIIAETRGIIITN